QSSYFALEGADDLLETIQRIKARPNPELEVLGVVVTLHDRRTTLSKDIYDQICQVFGDKVFTTTISKSVRLEESPAYKESIFTLSPASTGVFKSTNLGEEVIRRACKKSFARKYKDETGPPLRGRAVIGLPRSGSRTNDSA